MASTGNSDPWWPFGAPRADGTAALVCLPFAGGGAGGYREWRRAGGLGAYDVCPLQLPGREGRLRDAPRRRIGALVDHILAEVDPALPPAFALFGYSMGALIAFEWAHRRRERGRPAPAALFVAAAPAPHRRDLSCPVHDLPDADFKEALRHLRGTPEEVLAHDELMELLLPLLRADFEMCDTYEPAPREPLTCPILAFAGDEDPNVRPDQLDAWGELTTGGFRAVTLPGGHFLLDVHGDRIRREIRQFDREESA